MGRSALRSTSGCLRCRQRRIKCGEEKPICAKCSRWNFECVWPIPQNSRKPEDHESTRTFLALSQDQSSALQHRQVSAMVTGYDSFQSDTHRQLVENAIQFVGRYANYGLGSGEGDLTFCTTLVLQTPWSRSALSAFTASAISRWDPRFKSLGFNSYQAAVVHLRVGLSSQSIRDDDVRFLTSIFFLGLMEYFAHGRPGAAFNHLSIVAQKFTTLQDQLSNDLHDSSNRWIITMINLALNLCANFFLIEPRITSMFGGGWDGLDTFYLRCVQPLAKAYNIGMVEETLRTGIQLRLNRLVYEQPKTSHIEDALRHIDALEKYIRPTVSITTHQDPASFNMMYGWLSEIFAMRLYVTALANPNVCSNDPRLLALAGQWREYNMIFLRSFSQDMPLGQPLLPFTRLGMMSHLAIGLYYVPLLCALSQLDWFEEVAAVYASLDVVLDADVESRIQQMIESIRQRKTTTQCTLDTHGYCCTQHDGLDVLRHPQGVLC